LKILVTGSAGFIGFHLVNRLLIEGHQVIGLDNINDYYDTKIKINRLKNSGIYIDKISSSFKHESNSSSYIFYKCDLTDKVKLNYIYESEKPEAVCNLAAQAGVRYSIENPKAYIDSNIIGFQNIIDLCNTNGINNLCYASSSSVYGANSELPFSTKDRVDYPISLYAATKKSNELIAHTYSHLFGIRTTGLRFFTVYGPWGRPDMALFLFVNALIKDQSIDVYNHGNMLRDFTYIDDIIQGVLDVILNPAKVPEFDCIENPTRAPYKIYNIGNNNPVKLMDFIEVIESKLNKKFKINFMDIQPGDVPNTYADVSDFLKDFNYKPNTSIQTGIQKFIDWYIEYYKTK
tara:strand:- start:481 stop:1521 length:1041 start_codon:yes stop_codon:yes gene_type:complete